MKTISLRKSAEQPDNWPDTRCLPWVIDMAEWLRHRGYPLADRQRILTSLLDHGTLLHAVESRWLDAEDYALAEAIYCESQPAIPYDDPAWLDSDLWMLGGPELELPGTVQQPAEQQPEERPDWKNWESLVNSWNLPPISGGAPTVSIPDVFERMAVQAEKIIRLQAELDAIPADWSDNYYPF